MPAIRNIAVGMPVKDGHVLLLAGYDRVRDLHFYRAVGGGIEFGETAEAALRREFMEELGWGISGAQLLTVLENVYAYEGRPGHEISHVFAVDSPDIDAVPLDAELTVLDEGSPVRWISIDELRRGSRPLFPEGAIDYLPGSG